MTDQVIDMEIPPEALARATSEMRHRVANTFQFLAALARMRSQKAVSPDVKRQLGWMADAIGSLGALERHRRGDGVDFASYLGEMAPIWRRRQGLDAPEVVVDAHSFTLNDNAAAAVAVIAQELVGNALVHAFPGGGGRVVIRLSDAADGRCELTVSDDGAGFDPQSEDGQDGFGLWLVRSLASQARGAFELATSPSGTIGRLNFAV
ncbi:MAG TPA: sensor histidine kinase [Phenylobacterium sp.]